MLISPASLLSSSDIFMCFSPFPEKWPLFPTYLLQIDVNVILGKQIFGPFETREVEIFTKMEITGSRGPEATSKAFLCVE